MRTGSGHENRQWVWEQAVGMGTGSGYGNRQWA